MKNNDGGRYRKRVSRVQIYSPKRCGDDVTQSSGFLKEACRRSVENSHSVIYGCYALCRECMVRILTAEMSGDTELHSMRVKDEKNS